MAARPCQPCCQPDSVQERGEGGGARLVGSADGAPPPPPTKPARTGSRRRGGKFSTPCTLLHWCWPFPPTLRRIPENAIDALYSTSKSDCCCVCNPSKNVVRLKGSGHWHLLEHRTLLLKYFQYFCTYFQHNSIKKIFLVDVS